MVERRVSRGSIAIVVLATAACLIPFASKALHIDDPLFLWAGEQIREHPGDFYGFTDNWYGRAEPAADVIKNPPGGAYLVALVLWLVGSAEVALHLAFLLPALGVTLGTFFLAREFGADPLLASLAALFNPVFLISSTQIMCDVTMLCFWVWAVWFWLRGLASDRPFLLAVSGCLLAACALTKYFGVSLIPLLLLHGALRKRAPGRWMVALAIPVVLLGLYQALTAAMYGRGLLLDAVAYAGQFRLSPGRDLFDKTLAGLAFTGGGLSLLLFFVPRLWSRLAVGVAAAVLVTAALALPLAGSVGGLVLADDTGARWGASAQLSLFGLLGIGWIVLAIRDWRTAKDADAALLSLWLIGTFAFATFVNWSVNGRSVLPMVPAAGILLARQLAFSGRAGLRIPVSAGLLLAALLALLPTWADFRLANSARDAAARISAAYGDRATVWFVGHWGFQLYMERAGARAIEMNRLAIEPGDLLVSPSNNTNRFEFPAQALGPVTRIDETPTRWVSTMSRGRSGFYTDVWSALPFAFGAVPPEVYTVQPVTLELRTHPGR